MRKKYISELIKGDIISIEIYSSPLRLGSESSSISMNRVVEKLHKTVNNFYFLVTNKGEIFELRILAVEENISTFYLGNVGSQYSPTYAYIEVITTI